MATQNPPTSLSVTLYVQPFFGCPVYVRVFGATPSEAFGKYHHPSLVLSSWHIRCENSPSRVQSMWIIGLRQKASVSESLL